MHQSHIILQSKHKLFRTTQHTHFFLSHSRNITKLSQHNEVNRIICLLRPSLGHILSPESYQAELCIFIRQWILLLPWILSGRRYHHGQYYALSKTNRVHHKLDHASKYVLVTNDLTTRSLNFHNIDNCISHTEMWYQHMSNSCLTIQPNFCSLVNAIKLMQTQSFIARRVVYILIHQYDWQYLINLEA